MKKMIPAAVTFLIMVVCPRALMAQPRPGSIVNIKNNSVPTYVQTKTGGTDTTVIAGPVNRTSAASCKWRIIKVPDGYMFQSLSSNYFLGIQSDTGAGHQSLVLRRMYAPRRTEMLWLLIPASNGYIFKNRKSLKFMNLQTAGSNMPYFNLVQSASPTAAYVWSITLDSLRNITVPDTVKRVLFDVQLNYVAVTEATRNRIDNSDCLRLFGEIKTEVWELTANNNKVKKVAAYENAPEFLFKQENYHDPATTALSYYQDNRELARNSYLGKVTYNIPETLFMNRRLMLIIKVYMGTRHKDSNLSSYDALRMREERQFTYILENRGERMEMLEVNTERNGSDMKLSAVTVPGNTFGGDDGHRLFIAVKWQKM